MKSYLNNDTICAPATAMGHAGLSVIRISGKAALDIFKKLNPILAKKQIESHKAYFTNIFNKNELVDEVVFIFFKEGKSYTGEDTVEISCHGSPILVQEIMNLLVENGARVAERGEFTYRAFMNQRIDLVQAESVLSLIESQSKQAARQSLRQLKGGLSSQVTIVEELLTFVLANLEASIDFSTEDIDPMDVRSCLNKIEEAEKIVNSLLSTYNSGRLIQNGFKVALVGKPNVGKSSLLNALIGEDKAIVSEYAGTTRDLVEGVKTIEGIKVSFIDTAGLHKTNDPIEKIGIKKSEETIIDSDLIFHIIEPKNHEDNELLASNLTASLIDRENVIRIYSKKDLYKPEELKHLKGAMLCSSLSGEGVDQLLNIIKEKITQNYSQDSVVVYQARHFDLFTKVKERLEKSKTMIINDASQEFIALELQEALMFLYEILGKRFDDEVMDRVFREFCIGK